MSASQPPPRSAPQPALTELLNEIRILLPGTEVFLGFLATLPFTDRFSELDGPRRIAYIATFLSTILSLVLFVVPAAYHRLARPIRNKERFKLLANRFLIAGLVPMSLSMVLATYLVTHVVAPVAAVYLAAFIGLLILVVWWVIPLVRAHNRMDVDDGDDRRPSVYPRNDASSHPHHSRA
jgi:hypothetical protein